jgi:hypothetical protein
VGGGAGFARAVAQALQILNDWLLSASASNSGPACVMVQRWHAEPPEEQSSTLHGVARTTGFSQKEQRVVGVCPFTGVKTDALLESFDVAARVEAFVVFAPALLAGPGAATGPATSRCGAG